MKPAILLLSLLGAASTFAQSMELSASGGFAGIGGRSLGYLGYGDNFEPRSEVTMRSGQVIAFRLSMNRSWFGQEFGAAFVRNKVRAPLGTTEILLDARRRVTQLFYGFLIYPGTDDESKLRPFIVFGPAYCQFDPKDVWEILGEQNSKKFGGHFGGGLKVRMSRYWGLRFDYREVLTAKPLKLISQKGPLRQIELSAGVSLIF